jgi:ketosteroid isomerase-like protein
MSIEENKRLVRRYYEDAPQNPDVCDAIFAPRIRFHAIHHTAADSDGESDPESEKGYYKALSAVWGAWSMTIDEMIAEGDRVVVRWTFRGTHQGEYLGVPPTGREATFSGINIFRIEDGRIAEILDIFDRLWLWQQLGVLPDTAEFIAKAREAILSERDA